jgi:ankyrin repeat protein
VLIGNLVKPTKAEMARANDESLGIISAVYCAHDNLLQSILMKNPKMANFKNRDNWTPLHYAMCIGCSDAATVLINAGADAAAKTSEGVSAITLGARLAI